MITTVELGGAGFGITHIQPETTNVFEFEWAHYEQRSRATFSIHYYGGDDSFDYLQYKEPYYPKTTWDHRSGVEASHIIM